MEQATSAAKFLRSPGGLVDTVVPITPNTLQPSGLEPLASPVGVALCASGPVHFAFVGAMGVI